MFYDNFLNTQKLKNEIFKILIVKMMIDTIFFDRTNKKIFHEIMKIKKRHQNILMKKRFTFMKMDFSFFVL